MATSRGDPRRSAPTGNSFESDKWCNPCQDQGCCPSLAYARSSSTSTPGSTTSDGPRAWHLTENLQMARVARDWSDVMLRETALYHNPNLSAEVQGPLTRLGENVGRGLLPGDVTLLDRGEHLHGLFMNSQGHRANILGPWSQMGAGVLLGADGTSWVPVTFLQGPADGFPLFRDIGGSVHEGAINALWERGVAPWQPPGIVRGCAKDRCCPQQGGTRAQMASFSVQASPRMDPIPGSPFADVTPGAVHSDNINALAVARVTLGCTTDRYCPRANVTRAQIASFLVRAFPR